MVRRRVFAGSLLPFYENMTGYGVWIGYLTANNFGSASQVVLNIKDGPNRGTGSDRLGVGCVPGFYPKRGTRTPNGWYTYP